MLTRTLLDWWSRIGVGKMQARPPPVRGNSYYGVDEGKPPLSRTGSSDRVAPGA